jgi:hypothetical protein
VSATQTLAGLQVFLNSPDLGKDLGNRAQRANCLKFLTGLIENLGSTLAPGFTVNRLIENIGKASKSATSYEELRANARTTGNTIRMVYNPVEPVLESDTEDYIN